MSDLDALLVAIVTHPDEDTPRLEFADALDERGAAGDPERAEFVRVQVKVAGLSATPARPPDKPTKEGWASPGYVEWKSYTDRMRAWRKSGDEKVAILARERELLRGAVGPDAKFNVCRWTGFPVSGRGWLDDGRVEFATGVPIGPFFYGRFRRGFLDEVMMSAADFLKHADALVWHPEQAAKCDQFGYEAGEAHALCARCRGRGWVRTVRPCPPTAHPVRRVLLTTWGAEIYGLELSRLKEDGVLTCASPRWPNVTFRATGSRADILLNPIPALGAEVVSDDAEVDPADQWDALAEEDL